MYGIFLAFGQFGPGDCMGLNAMELFPTAVRGTGYGFAAGKLLASITRVDKKNWRYLWYVAIGKVGATVGTLAFKPMQATLGVRGPFLVGSGIALVASAIAFFFLPDVGPDFLAEQDASFESYLQEHNYDTTLLGLGKTRAYSSTDKSEVNDN